jgi:AhpD family alkylhydroperoxidase
MSYPQSRFLPLSSGRRRRQDGSLLLFPSPAMTQRLNFFAIPSEVTKKYSEFSQSLKTRPIAREMDALVTIRASQLNGCGFCVDMHVKQARLRGERELRLHHIAIWRESDLFSARERAALAWTEALTRMQETSVPDAIYAEAREHFSEEELLDLTFLVVLINGWNRANAAFRTRPGLLDAQYGLDKAGLQ